LVSVSESGSIFPKIRNRILNFYGRNFPQPDASLIAGITLGAKTSLPKDFWDSLIKTGTAHIVVASGMIVTFVAGFLMAVLVLFFKRKIAIPVCLAGIWFYSALSGFDAPIVRAAIMGSVAFSAQELGRLLNAYKALFLTGLIMLIIVPQWLTDIGFILSFVATLSLMVFEKKIEKFVKFLPGFFKEGLATSLAAQIGVAPILFVTFGQFNVFSPVINALVLWTIPPIMIIGAVSGILGVIFEPLGRFILYLAYPLTSWFIWIVIMFQ
jgi:competence protein ComEC